jgi:3-mercaptopyruvate sulfurtransferase SseA
MARKWGSRRTEIFVALCLASLLVVGIVRNTARGVRPVADAVYAKSSPLSQMPPADPWSTSQIVQPADFAKELAATSAAKKTIVVCTGFRVLYQGAHVPGASFHGPANSVQGLDDLKKWAQGIPRSANVVVYCGCCPLWHCPNIRPAFAALRDMGFTHLRVLLLPTNLNTDWIEKGYPVEK